MEPSLRPRNSDAKTAPGALTAWLARHRSFVLGLVVLLSVGVRVVYFAELDRGPCIQMHEWDQTDMNFFHLWAREIAGGDLLVDKFFFPDHIWYGMVADLYLGEHPEERPVLEREARTEGMSVPRLLWKRWVGEKEFNQDPLYPYFIAVNYAVFGEDPRWAFLWQMLAGVGTNVLVYLLARRYFGDVVAVVAALLAVFYGPLVFYELVLLRDSLLVFTGLALVYATEIVKERRHWSCWVLYGLAVGLASLLKNIFLPYWASVMAILLWQRRQAPRVWITHAAASLAGVVLGLLPLIARNLTVGVPPLGLARSGAVTFICTNGSHFDASFVGTGGPMDFQLTAHILGRTNGQFLPSVLETLQTHDSVWSYLNLVWMKLGLMWNWYEAPDNISFYYYQLHSPLLSSLLTFSLVSPLALVGLILAAPRFRSCWPLYLFALFFLALLLVFCPLSRWRLPLVTALLPFAALVVVSVARWLQNGQVKRALATLAGVAVVFFGWTSRPLPEGRPLNRYVDYSAPFNFYYQPMLAKAEREGNWPAALATMSEVLRFEPEDTKQMGLSRPARNREESDLAMFAAGLHHMYGQALRKSGQEDWGLQHESRAAEILESVPPVFRWKQGKW